MKIYTNNRINKETNKIDYSVNNIHQILVSCIYIILGSKWKFSDNLINNIF